MQSVTNGRSRQIDQTGSFFFLFTGRAGKSIRQDVELLYLFMGRVGKYISWVVVVIYLLAEQANKLGSIGVITSIYGRSGHVNQTGLCY